MLAGEQRRRHHDRDLPPVDGGGEGGAQRHLGLAEANVAAHEPVHRVARGEVAEHGLDGMRLVVGLVVGEAGAELVVDALGRHELHGGLQGAFRRDLDQPVGDLADAVLHPRLAALPAGAAEPVELRLGVLRAVARQEFEVLDRQEQLGILGVVQLQAIVRVSRDRDRPQARRSGRCRGRRGPRSRPARGSRPPGGNPARGEASCGLRTRRSPRMSCSPMRARSPAVKPCSSPSTARATAPGGKPKRLGERAHGFKLLQPVFGEGPRAAGRATPHSRPRRRRACPRSDKVADTCATAASNTLVPSRARSGAKERLGLPPQSTSVDLGRGLGARRRRCGRRGHGRQLERPLLRR